MKKAKLDLATAKLMYKSSEEGIKQFALLNYTEEELTKAELPKRWDQLNRVVGYFIEGTTTNIIRDCTHNPTFCPNARNLFPIKEQARATLALSQLFQLREVYRQGKEPQFNHSETSYSIIVVSGQWKVLASNTVKHNTFSFSDSKTCDLFFENFKGLLEEVKPLFI